MEDGPFTVDQLKRMASEGELDQNVRIRLGKTTEWVEPQHMDWLQEYFGNASQTVTGKTPLEIPSIPVAPDASPGGIATPWYVFAVISVGAMVLLGLVVLILMEFQKNGEGSFRESLADSGGRSGGAREKNSDFPASTEDLLDPKPANHSDSDDEKPEPDEAIGFVINNVEDVKRIEQAVGFVVCGWKGVDEDGKSFESLVAPRFYSAEEVAALNDSQQEDMVILDSGIGVEWLLGAQGSCFMVAADGFMLTNMHVIEEVHSVRNNPSTAGKIKKQFDFRQLQPTVWVILQGTAHQAQIVHVSDRFDLAILKIDVSRSPCFKLAAADQLPRLTQVWTIGFPGAARTGLTAEEEELEYENFFLRGKEIESLFKSSDFEYVITEGAVSVVQHRVESGDLIYHTAKFTGGNSGGPLVDENGTAWGINTWGIGESSAYISPMTGQLRSEIDDHVRRCTWE